MSEPAQLALDANDTPVAVLGGEPDDQHHHILWDRWASRWLGLAPLRSKQATVPAQKGTGSDDPACTQRLGQQPGQRREHGPIRPTDPRPRARPTQHRHLVTQREYLDVLRRRGPGQQRQPGEHLNHSPVQQSHSQDHRSYAPITQVKAVIRVFDQDRQQTLLDILAVEPVLLADQPGQTVIGDENYFGRAFETQLADAGAVLLRQARKG